MTQLVWHGHHEVMEPLELLLGTLEERIAVINKDKPIEERERRLHLIKAADISLFPQGLQNSINKFNRVYERKGFSVNQQVVYAWDKLQSDLRDYLPEILKVHATECGCGWTKQNPNIFHYLP